MSRPSQLPPRCPFQRKPIPRATHEPNPCSSAKAHTSLTRHHKSLSQGSTLDDHPSWLDDLLSDSEDSSPRGIFHSRSSSDSASLFDRLDHDIRLPLSKNEEHSESEEVGNTLESSCIYGPNSPRKKSSVELSDSSLLMALSDYASQSSVPYVEDSVSWGSRTREDYCSPNDFNCEPNSGKRHPSQRSRARKLQYIGELERTVNVLQTMESELAIRISTLRQQKLILSMENSKLKQQMTIMQQRKLIMDGEYESLRIEAERLKLGLTYDTSNETDDTQTCWSNLDWKKLHL